MLHVELSGLSFLELVQRLIRQPDCNYLVVSDRMRADYGLYEHKYTCYAYKPPA